MPPLLQRICGRLYVCLLATACCLQPVAAQAQGTPPLSITFVPMAAGVPLVLDSVAYPTGNGNMACISMFKCYISGITLLQNGRVVWQEPDSWRLLDAAAPESLTILPGRPAGLRYDAVRFSIGIDSATNAAGAQGGALDATKGMYWAWHSGYVNLKIEGSSPACATRKHQFEYHLGGFLPGQYCLRSVTLPVAAALRIGIDITGFLRSINPAAEPAVNTPGARAVALSAQAAAMFYALP